MLCILQSFQSSFVLLLVAGLAFAQAGSGNAAAKAAFAEGQAAMKKSDFVQAAAAFRKAVELDPNSAEAHKQFVSASYRSRKPEESDAVRQELWQLYQAWAEKHADNAFYQYHLGNLCGKEKGKAEAYYRKAVQLDPKLADAWMALSLIAETRGEKQQRIACLKQAVEAAPENPEYWVPYAYALRETDMAECRKVTQEIVRRFPQHDRAAQALYWLAFETKDEVEKRMLLEGMYRDFPPAKFSWSHSAMDDLFNLCVIQEPARALALAEELAKHDPKDKEWAAKLAMQQSVNRARSLIAGRKFAEAASLLEPVVAPRYTNASPLYLTRAEALAAGGDTAKAFAVLAKVVAEAPTDSLVKGLNEYAAKLGRTAAQVASELQGLRTEKAAPFKDFSLGKYIGEGMAAVADYRGKVVLVDFWYPTCGPCRGESPNLQKALDKYGAQGFVILSINLEPSEDEMVLPYLKNNHYDFVPLKSNWDWARETYGVRGAPSHFLIDREGRLIFKPPVLRSEDSYRTFELQLEALLSQSKLAQ
jgi:tetratricopeptide (TPR) repeat protein